MRSGYSCGLLGDLNVGFCYLNGPTYTSVVLAIFPHTFPLALSLSFCLSLSLLFSSSPSPPSLSLPLSLFLPPTLPLPPSQPPSLPLSLPLSLFLYLSCSPSFLFPWSPFPCSLILTKYQNAIDGIWEMLDNISVCDFCIVWVTHVCAGFSSTLPTLEESTHATLGVCSIHIH